MAAFIEQTGQQRHGRGWPDLAGSQGLQGVKPLQDALHVVLQPRQRHHDLLVQAAAGLGRSSPAAPVSASRAVQGTHVSRAEAGRR